MRDLERQAEQLSMLHYEHLKELSLLAANIAGQGEDGVLLCLYVAGRTMLSGDIVDKTGLTTGRVANILRQLEGKRLIRRFQDAADRRRVHVSLTPEGFARAEALNAEANLAHQKLLAYLGERDSAELIRIMQRCFAYSRENLLPDR
ncbi:MAG: winged helix DNA-binding protein [Clostridia bacterium]|nr:winged helix DNA-binding protein [Clostridia bacterium]